MTTFDDDMVRLNLQFGGEPLIPCKALGFEWPPPEFIALGDGGKVVEATEDDDSGTLMRRVAMSEITDEQRQEMTHVCRGAEYRYVERV